MVLPTVPMSSLKRSRVAKEYVPEVMPPPPIPAIALAAIRLFILGAKAQKAVPKPDPLVPLRQDEDDGKRDQPKNDRATKRLFLRPMMLHNLP
jgi:hypothetical protein